MEVTREREPLTRENDRGRMPVNAVPGLSLKRAERGRSASSKVCMGVSFGDCNTEETGARRPLRGTRHE